MPETFNLGHFKTVHVVLPNEAVASLGHSGGRVYYSRFEGVPKNTMYVLKQGEHFYFGIARCNLRDDSCVKAVGRELAYNRAREAQQRCQGKDPPCLLIEADGNSGACRAAAIGLIKEYFFNLNCDEKTERREQNYQYKQNDFFTDA